jgi:hypothetical protein
VGQYLCINNEIPAQELLHFNYNSPILFVKCFHTQYTNFPFTSQIKKARISTGYASNLVRPNKGLVHNNKSPIICQGAGIGSWLVSLNSD